MFCPDETNSNRLNSVFEATNRCFMAETVSIDDELSPEGRVMEVLSEHCCEGWLEGYLLTGRHGMWSSYEAFAQVVDSMLTQHAKWLEQCHDFSWRKPLASLNVLLTSHAWRKITTALAIRLRDLWTTPWSAGATTIRAYYPPDGNCLLSVFDHCLRSRNYVNIVTCGKQPQLAVVEHGGSARALFARRFHLGNSRPTTAAKSPTSCSRAPAMYPTIETCAASWLLHKHVPGIKVRVVNVVDLTM